jgi:hypothetical protein
MGEWVMIHKQGKPRVGMRTIVAHSPSLDGDFIPFGDNGGVAMFTLKDGTVANWTHENFGFFQVQAALRVFFLLFPRYIFFSGSIDTMEIWSRTELDQFWTFWTDAVGGLSCSVVA